MVGKNIKELICFDNNSHGVIVFLQNAEIRRLKNKKNYFSVSLCLCVMFFSHVFFSCQTAPPSIRTPEAFLEEGILPLDKGALVYLAVNVNEAHSFINLLPVKELNDNTVRQMIDRSDFAAAAIFPAASGRRFQITTWGNYPKSAADMALGTNKNWTKRQNENRVLYWHSPEDRISMAVSPRNLFVVSSLNNTPVNPITTGDASAELPEGFADFYRGAVLSCWMNSPSSMLQQILDKAGVPLRVPVNQLFFNLYSGNQAQKQYEAVIRLEFESASQARGMAAILNLAGAFSSNDPAMQIAKLLLSNRPVQTDRYLDIKVDFTREAEIIQLITNLTGML